MSRAVAIVTGGSSVIGREVTRGLARWGWAIVVVYLEDQRRAEATVAEILAADGTTVAVRADLADDLDVQRLFAESIAAFGGVDAVVHTTTDSASLLYQHAVEHVREGGAIVSVSAAERISRALQMSGLRLVCDWTDQPSYDVGRVRSIIEGTGGLVAILPHRGTASALP